MCGRHARLPFAPAKKMEDAQRAGEARFSGKTCLPFLPWGILKEGGGGVKFPGTLVSLFCKSWRVQGFE